MTIPRIYVPGTIETGGVCNVTPDQARYLSTVLRMKPGDPLRIFNGSGWEYDARIRRQTAEGTELAVTDRHAAPIAAIHITLCQAVPKAEKMDGIIRHATELGVERIIPFLAARSVPRWEPEQRSRKRQRWQKIATEASRQCGRADVPEITEILTFERMVQAVPEHGLRLIPWEEETKTHISALLRDPAGSRQREFSLAIGPEGGFSAAEIELARQAGFLSVSLGRRVLRVETASLALLAILQYEVEAREAASPRLPKEDSALPPPGGRTGNMPPQTPV